MKLRKSLMVEKKGSPLIKIFLVISLLLFMIPDITMAWPSIATEENLKDAILEKDLARFSSMDLELMDLNNDGILDVADLIYYLKTEEIEVPIITFDMRQTETYEGAGDAQVQLTFSMPYDGQIKYRENGVEKTMAVSGLQGVLIVDNPDDVVRSTRARMVELEILYDADMAYVPGIESLHSVVIHENDSLWNGTIHNDVYANVGDDLMDTSLNIHFQLEIIQSGGVVNASVFTDGNGIIPKNGSLETWPMGNVTFSPSGFTADVLNIPSANDNFNAGFSRNLQFAADFEDQTILPWERTVIAGQVIETLRSSGYPFLNRSVTGSFVLFKNDPTVSDK